MVPEWHHFFCWLPHHRTPTLNAQTLNVSNAMDVVHKMMRATKAVFAPSRSANIDTLLAEGKAAANMSVTRPASGTVRPAARRA